MILATVFLVISFLCYQVVIFGFSDQILEGLRIKRGYRFFFYLVNGVLGYFLTTSDTVTDAFSYFVIFILLFLEMLLFYKDSSSTVFFLSSSFILHLMAVRSVCIAFVSLYTNLAVYKVVEDDFLVTLTMALTVLLLAALIFLVKRIIPIRELKIITQHRELLLLMGVWEFVFNLYLIFNAFVYTEPTFHPKLVSNQLSAPLAILIGFYVVLFFAGKAASLIGYKEKSEELEQSMKSEKQYRVSMASEALLTYEVNLSKNRIIAGFEDWIGQSGRYEESYSDVIFEYAHQRVFSDDIRLFLQQNSILFLLAEFDSGKHTVACEYRLRLTNLSYVWTRAVTNLVRDIRTGDIKIFTFAINIDQEKKRQIELQFKAERDSLTGLYNKGMTNKLISEHLLYNMRNARGALFVIDIDNFKTVNDTLGHVYGDSILCEFAEKIRASFRGDDIIGRIGGDEFIVFMKNAANREVIQAKAQELNGLCKQKFSDKTGALHVVSCSIGIAVFPGDGGDFQELYKNADSALYEIKNNGKNFFSFFDSKKVY